MSDRSIPWEVSRRLLERELPRRWRHVRAVASRAQEAAPLLDGQDDRVTLVSAAILHDVGYSGLIAQTGFHPLDGARYLRSIGVPDRLCALVAHHSCAYLEAEIRGRSAELAEWEDEQTVLRDILWWADMTTTPDGEQTNVHDRIAEIQKRYGPEDLVTFFIRQAETELVAAAQRTEDRLRTAGIDYVAK
jgi:hypothetical protein